LLENHKNFFSSKEEVQFYLKNLSSPSRFLFLMHCFFEAFNLKKKAQKGHKDFLLIDAYWYKYFTLECVYGADKEWMLKVISLFPKMTTYYIEESLEEQLRRKEESLTLYESGGEAKNKNFFLFQEKAKIFWKQLEEEFYFKKITEKTVEERTNAILKDLETYVYFCQ